jgi:hypothetical protein
MLHSITPIVFVVDNDILVRESPAILIQRSGVSTNTSDSTAVCSAKCFSIPDLPTPASPRSST